MYESMSYIDGVPVKVSEKYRTPRKVTLSAAFFYRVKAETLTAEYDTTVEMETLRLLRELRAHKDRRKEERTKRIEIYEEEKQKRIEEEKKRMEEEEEMKKIEEEKQREENEAKERLKEGEEKENDQEDNDIEDSNTEPSNTFVVSPTSTRQPDPTPSGPDTPNILVPVQCVRGPPPPDAGKSGAINFADFEAGSDPFDSAALNSINDMEELAKVLQSSSIPANRLPPGGIYNPTYSYLPPSSAASNVLNGASGFKSYYNENQYSNPTYWAIGGQASTSVTSASSQIQSPPTYINSVPQAAPSNIKTAAAIFTPTMNPPARPPLQPPEEEQQELERFYNKYYNVAKGAGGAKESGVSKGAWSGRSTPTQGVQENKGMTSSTSVPDLTTYGGRADGDAHENSPETFSALSPPARAVAMRLRQMGFPAGACAMAATRIGATEDKHLVESLLELRRFEDELGGAGGVPEGALREAFFSLGEKEANERGEKMRSFADAFKQLCSLSFPEGAVTSALLQSDNSMHEALHKLLTEETNKE